MLCLLGNSCVVQVAERGLAFVRSFSEILAGREAQGGVPPLFRECWAFSACVSLAKVTSRAYAAMHASRRTTDAHKPVQRPIG